MPVVRCWSRRAGGHCPAGSAVWQGGYADTKPPRAIQAGQLSGPAPASFTYVNGAATVRNRTRKEAPPEGSPRGLCACRKPLSNSQDASTNLTRPAWFQLILDREHVTPSPLRTYQSAPAFLMSSSSVERGASGEGKSMSHLANVITSNRILGALRADDLDFMHPHLERVPLRHGDALVLADRQIESVYFIEKGLASTIAESTPDAPVEVGMAGCEGLVG